MKIAFLGGSFNPPHLSHQLACLVLLEAEGFDQVWLVPCYRHAFSKQLVDFNHRLRMCRLLARPFGKRVRVSEVERRALYRGRNRTRHTLEYLSHRYPSYQFWLVVGSDLIDELPYWQDSDLLLKEFPLLVLRRSGYPASGPFKCTALELPAISSTRVRKELEENGNCTGLIPATVAAYIRRHRLYRR